MMGINTPGSPVNGRIMAWSVVVLLVAVSAQTYLARTAPAASGSIDDVDASPVAAAIGNVVTIQFARALGEAGVAPTDVRLVVNDGDPRSPARIVNGEATSRLLTLHFHEGVGPRDTARLVGGGLADVDVRVDTPSGTLPTPRFMTTVAKVGDSAYVLGGATAYSPLRRDWMPLDSILVVDLPTGQARTLGVQLPEPRYEASAFFDARPSPECPEGCVYVWGGVRRDREPDATIVRIDVASERATVLEARVPLAPGVAHGRPVTLWTGEEAYLMGGMSPLIHRFDPAAGTLEVAGASALLQANGMASVFDSRPFPGCPRGCGYLFGGAYPMNPQFVLGFDVPVDHERDTILRFDPASGSVTALAARLPEPRSHAAVALIGERAVIVGGDGCLAAACALTSSAVRFDPASLSVEPLTPPGFLLLDAVGVGHGDEVVVLGGILGNRGEIQALTTIERYAPPPGP